MKAFTLSLVLSLAGLSLGRTDLAGCVSSQTTNQWHEASMIWYVPDSGEICDFVDCGGGRAPPKTTQPGCPLYSGTATLTPSYLPGWGPNGKIAASTTTAAETTSTSKSKATASDESTTEHTATVTNSMITPAPTSSGSMTTAASSTSKTGNSTTSSSATSPSSTGNAAGAFSADVSGVMLIAAVAMAAIAL